jgi:hypothetical protein
VLQPKKCWVRVQLRVQSGESPNELRQSPWQELQEGSLDSEERFRQQVQQLVSELGRLLPPWLVPLPWVTRSVRD